MAACSAGHGGKGIPGGSTTEAVVSGPTLPTSAPRDPAREEAQTAAPRSAAETAANPSQAQTDEIASADGDAGLLAGIAPGVGRERAF